MRRPFHCSGMVIVRAYQPMSALSGTPESGEPHEKGTRIWRGAGSCPRAQPPRSPSSRASRAKSQRPFRFLHSARSKSGRGCSGNGIESLRGPCERAVPTAARVAASTAAATRELNMNSSAAMNAPVSHRDRRVSTARGDSDRLEPAGDANARCFGGRSPPSSARQRTPPPSRTSVMAGTSMTSSPTGATTRSTCGGDEIPNAVADEGATVSR